MILTVDGTAHPEPGKPPGLTGRSSAVRAATHRALAARDRLLSDYPHWEAWRRQARAIKTEAITHLDVLLPELERAVTAWGGRVIWARDAAKARRLIIEIARRHGVKAVVKSKSMTTEEIGLNQGLAVAGLAVRETDLGEFIVQVAGHSPAHLTAPALHLNRCQIAEIFAAHLGLESPAEPEALSRQATTYLNPSFFEAQMGITGVNFAAPDGTLVLVENESNLRFTATLPQVHVALMGLEKIIPQLADVEVMLRLLPASATGQRLTALVHFIRGLKLRPQGNQAFYLVLLDNGRRRLAGDPEMAEALHCLRCGACLNACPIFQVGAAHQYGRIYPGAIGILLAPYLAPVGDICDLCTQCGACQEICPVGIRLRDKIHLLRSRSRRFRQLRGWSLAAGAVLGHPRWYRGLEPLWRGVATCAARWGWGGGMARVAPMSFHRQLRGRQKATAPSWRDVDLSQACLRETRGRAAAEPADPAPSTALLAERLQEACSSLEQVQSPAALARRLAGTAAPLWLEDHPWLRRVATELENLKVPHHVVRSEWAPPAGTAVTVALGAVPETGSVLVDSGGGPAATLACRAKKQIILIPPDQAHLSLSQAVAYIQRREPGMVSWLTGPSRTADIEKVLVLGAQGPASLEMILYQEEE